MNDAHTDQVAPQGLTAYQQRTIKAALNAMQGAMTAHGAAMTTPGLVKDYLRLQLAREDVEVFAVLFLDARHMLIEYRAMFRGTLTQTAVYPREVVRAALLLNAAAIVISHNHPSGVAEPSVADRALTTAIRAAAGLMEIAVLDHLIVAGTDVLSFAERGWMP